MATLGELVIKVTRRIGQVSGTGVQLYAEDVIADMLQHKFDVLFDEAWWPQFMHWQQVSLDGTTGVPTTNLATLTYPVKNFRDIRAVFPYNKDRALAKMSAHRQPNTLTGNVGMFVEPHGDPTRVFRILPVTATEDVIFHYRSKPDAFIPADTVDFDEQAMILGAAYDYLEDDGTNPGATQKFQNMFNSRVVQLKRELHNIAFDSDPYTNDTADEWWESQ